VDGKNQHFCLYRGDSGIALRSIRLFVGKNFISLIEAKQMRTFLPFSTAQAFLAKSE